mgnify:CR=1 FL=1
MYIIMGRKIVSTEFNSVDPTVIEDILAGYNLGMEWINETTGDKFYHETDGVWVKLNNVTVVADTYEEFYTRLEEGKLVPGATYKVPYKSVNFLNGVWVAERIFNQNNTPLFPSLTGMETHVGEEEILIIKAISNSEIEPYVLSEKYPNDIIEFNPLVTKLGVNLSITNGTTLPDASVAW